MPSAFGRIFPDRKISQIKLSEETVYNSHQRDRSVEAERNILNGPFHKSVQLDVLFEGDDSWFDIECQIEDTGNIPKRTRYYHSLIDAHILTKGKDYENLRPCFVIFICRFDLFGRDEAIYSFQNYDEKNHLPLGDESYTLLLNSKCSEDKVPESLKALFQYINQGECTPGRRC